MHDLSLHGARVAVCAGALALWPTLPGKVTLAGALFFALFALAHDLAHGALGLPRRWNARWLSIVALSMLMSGRAMRRMHLRHHARPLADDDFEGRGARRSLLGSLFASPFDALVLRLSAFHAAPPRERVVQLLETAGALAFLVAAWSGPVSARAYAAVALTLQATTGLWAAHLPHHAPAFAVTLAERLAFLRSPTLLSLAFHERHHHAPRIPCHRLAAAPEINRSARAESRGVPR